MVQKWPITYLGDIHTHIKIHIYIYIHICVYIIYIPIYADAYLYRERESISEVVMLILSESPISIKIVLFKWSK